MVRQSSIICLLIFNLSVAACEKSQKDASSQVQVDTSENTQRQLEESFQNKVRGLKTMITYGKLSLGRNSREYTYWGLPLKSQDGGEVVATFYFKKNESSVGPDINIEFADSGEMVSFYLNSYISARAALTADSPGGKIRVWEALDLLKKESDKKPPSQLMQNLWLSLNNLSKFLDRPTITKKFEGEDATGKACFIHTTNDLDGNILKVQVGYTDPKNSFPKANFFLGPVKLDTDICNVIEFDSTKKQGLSFHNAFYGYGITYERQWIKQTGVDNFEATQIEAGLYGGILLSAAACNASKLTLCQDRAQLKRAAFGGGAVTFLPFLGGAVKSNFIFDCRNLIPKT